MQDVETCIIRKRPFYQDAAIVAAVVIGHVGLFWGLMTVRPRLLPITQSTEIDDPITALPELYFVPRPEPPKDDILVPELQKNPALDTSIKIHKIPNDEAISASLTQTPTATSGQGGDSGDAKAGFSLKGRSALSQALQFQNACITAQQNGDPIPKDCQLSTLSQQKPVGPNPNYGKWKQIIEAKDAEIKYKRDAGSTDYWKRVTAAPGPRYEVPEPPAPGTFTNDKDARTHGQVNTH